jgi:hypothetical protein
MSLTYFPTLLRDAILSTWPTPDQFYLDRDNRTMLATAGDSSYACKQIEIVLDPEQATCRNAQMTAILACNLTARWARNICVYLPKDVPLEATLNNRDHEFLHQRIIHEMFYADPFGSFECMHTLPANSSDTRLRLLIGDWDTPSLRRHIAPSDFVVGCQGWTVMGRRGWDLASSNGVSDASPAVAGLGAALGVADLFKRAVGHRIADWIPQFNLDMFTYELTSGAPAKPARRCEAFDADLGNLLLAGVGAIGSSVAYLLDMMRLSGTITLLDRDSVETSNLNRSPLFDVWDTVSSARKTAVAAELLNRHDRLKVSTLFGTWHEHGLNLSKQNYDAWLSFTNEEGAWAEIPFQLPPVVLQGTTTSGAGRHVPRLDDCTLCRLPRPEIEFRGPCAEGEVMTETEGRQIRAALPFLSAAAGALVLGELLKLIARTSARNVSEVSIDLWTGLPSVASIFRRADSTCRGCKILHSKLWPARGGRGRYSYLSPSF